MKEIAVKIFDDLDFQETGTKNEASVTITVGFNGVWKQLDLTDANEKEVRDTLDRLMTAGSEPDEPPVPPSAKSWPERAAYNDRLRAWVRNTGLKNSSGTGWAYQTNTSLLDYIGQPLIRKYEAYLAETREGNK